jgi:catechol 2,3-dioxygenase
VATVSKPIASGARVGHVHLKVADLDRALGFYSGVLGFELTQGHGSDVALGACATDSVSDAEV